jgi:hypothetical protein
VGYAGSVRALAQYWGEISSRLSADTVRLVISLAGQLERASAKDALQAIQEIGRVLDQVLPRDDHPVRRALDASEPRSATFTQDWRELASQLLTEAESSDLTGATAPAPSAAEVTFWTGRWLLGQAAFDEDDLRDRGQLPDDRDLIRLDREDGGEQWPAFQFGPGGAALALVRTVNRLLDAGEDPWGVADWWLGHNQWLDGVPARLIGQIPDDLLIAAARAVDPGV